MQEAESSPTPNQIYVELIAALERANLARPVERLRRVFPADTPIFVVGGFPRDCARALIEHHPIKSKDADIVVDARNLASKLENFSGKLSRTSLGGFHWVPAGAAGWIDVWELSDTVWIRDLHLPPSIEIFLDGVDLNIDRIAVGLHDQTVLDGGCLAGLARRCIDLDAKIKLKKLGFDELARAVAAHLDTGYDLSERILRSLDVVDLKVLVERSSVRLSGDGYSAERIRRVRKFISNRRRAVALTRTEG